MYHVLSTYLVSTDSPLSFQDMLEYKTKVRHLKIKFMDGTVKTLQVIIMSVTPSYVLKLIFLTTLILSYST